MMVNWKEKNIAGTDAFPFELPDENGKIYSLKDFKGKLIIADFWFTGCMPCKAMARALKPIAESYRGNPNVVFLSINVDQFKIRWETGLKNGSYTFPGAIHLSTMGGESITDHSFLKYYNYKSFPQLLLIDKNAKIISTHPPIPSEDGLRKLMGVIAANLP